MKATYEFITAFIVTVFLSFPIYGQTMIKPGDKLKEWTLQDSKKQNFTMDSWHGKVLLISYVSPQHADLNDGLNDYITKAYEEKKISKDTFWGFGIVDCKSSSIPNGLIRSVAGRKARKYGTTILFDYNGLLQEYWGLPKNNYSVIIVDQEHICRGVYTGKIEKSGYLQIVDIIAELTR